MIIRKYKTSDLPAISQLYHDTVHRITARPFFKAMEFRVVEAREK